MGRKARTRGGKIEPKPPNLGGLGQGGNLPTDEVSRKRKVKKR